MSINLSPRIGSQLPDHIQESYPLFTEFVKKYYEFLETYEFETGKKSPLLTIEEFIQNKDIDTATEEFLTLHQSELGGVISRTYATKKQILIKHLTDVYATKGTEESIKLLFRLIFNSESSTMAPSKFILIPSDGRWIVPLYMVVFAFEGNPFLLQGRRIVGTQTKNSAFVELVLKFYRDDLEYYYLYLNRESIVGDFALDEFLTTENGDIIVQSEEI